MPTPLPTPLPTTLPTPPLVSPVRPPWWRSLRRRVLAHRRSLSVALAVLTVLAAVRAAEPPAMAYAEVVVAAADLPGGLRLGPDDLTVVAVPADTAPEGARGRPAAVVGRVLAAPVRRGEAITDVRVVGPGLLAGYPGLVAAPVRLADETAARLLRVGDRVTLVATPLDGGPAERVVESAPVVAIPRSRAGVSGPSAGALVVVAVPEDTALVLSELTVSRMLSALLRT